MKSIVNSRTGFYVLMAYLLFLILNYFYYSIFTVDYMEFWLDEQYSQFFYFPLNLDQQKAYVPILIALQNGEYVPLSSASGIAYIYWFLGFFVNINDETIPLASFVVNNLFVLASYYYFVKIGTEVLMLSLKYRWLFFLNPSLIYFSQLINKEMFSLALVLAMTYYLARKQYCKGGFVLLLATIQRLHYIVIMPLSLFLVRAPKKFMLKLFVLYVLFSLAAAYLVSPAIDLEGSALEGYGTYSGISEIIITLNQKYYIGSLLLNPIKIIQYFYDLFLSFFCITQDFKLNLYYVHNIPYLAFLIMFWRDMARVLINFRTFVQGPSIYLLATSAIFFLILLMSPMVHSRYLFPISYSIALLGIYSRVQYNLQFAKQKIRSS